MNKTAQLFNVEDMKKLSQEELVHKFDTNMKEGLSPEEAQGRLKEYGLNALPEKKVNPLMKILSYFWGPIPWMIEIAACIVGFGLFVTAGPGTVPARVVK